jgi:hypothetical protein
LVNLCFNLTGMKVPADIRYTERMLSEAMEMLEDLKHHMGMFQTQRYGKLKGRVKQYQSLNESLRGGLNNIVTVEDEKGEIKCCG